ncbi:MAG: helix-turn-helix domain-containing protein [Paludibacteraceae bacterium]
MKTYIYFLLILFIGIIATLPIKAGNGDYRYTKDSLQKIIDSKQGKEKIDAYGNLVEFLFYNDSNPENVIKAIKECEREAIRQKDKKTAAKCRGNIITVRSAHNQYKEILKNADADLKFIAEQGEWNLYFKTYSAIIEVYFFDGQKKKALDEAFKCYEKAKQINTPVVKAYALYTIGHIYAWSEREKEAMDYLEQGLREAEKNKDAYNIKQTIYTELAQIYSNKDQTDKLRTMLNTWETELKKQEAEGNSDKNSRLNFYYGSARYYLAIKDYDKMEYYCKLTEQTTNIPDRLSSLIYLRKEASIAKGDYKQAMQYVRQMKTEATQTNNVYDRYLATREEARVLIYEGKADESMTILDDAFDLRDSIFQSESHTQLNELRIQYEVDKLTAEKEINRQRWIIAVTTSTLLLILLIIYIAYSRRLSRKNKSLFEQVQQLTQKEKAVEQCLLTRPEESLSKEMRLFQRLSKDIKAEKLFTDPDLNRKKLADHIGSNESYLADAIKQATGETFSVYISNLRLQYAIELLDNNPDITLEAIAVDSGHGSYSPFYRAFTKKYGITPSEYRRLSSATKRK